MVTVKVDRDFFDLQDKVLRHAGDTFECSKERAEHIASALDGYITIAEPAKRSVSRKKSKGAQ